MSDIAKYRDPKFQDRWWVTEFTMEQIELRLSLDAAQLRELRAVLSALGAVKGPEGWTVPDPHDYEAVVVEKDGKRIVIKERRRIPVPLAAQKEGGAG